MAKWFKTIFASGGDATPVPNPTQPGGDVSYEQGFGFDYEREIGTDPDALAIPRAQFNQLLKDITGALQQYQTRGFPDFVTSAENDGSPVLYPINATVRFENGHGGAGFMNYYSLVNGNTADPTDNTKWGLVVYSQGEETGFAKMWLSTVLPVGGWVWLNGTTLGSAASGATGRANADTLPLYTVLWNSFTNVQLPIQDSTGAASTRGISAAADFAANKRLPTPNFCEVVPMGRSTMGGAAARSLITQAVVGTDPAVLGATFGAQNVALTSANNGPHTHGASIDPDGLHNHIIGDRNGASGQTDGGCISASISSPPYRSQTLSNGTHTHGIDIDSSGSGTPHLNVQPTIAINFVAKL